MTSPSTTPEDEPATFYWKSFTDLASQPKVARHRDGYAVINFGESYGDLSVHLRTAAQCDAIIKAAVTAKDLLAAQKPGPPTAELPGSHVKALLCHATTPARHPGGKFLCTLDAGHDGDHEAGGTGKPPLSWPQEPASQEPPPECSACGATTELAAVRDTGGDGSVLYYCGDLEGCQARRIARAGAR